MPSSVWRWGRKYKPLLSALLYLCFLGNSRVGLVPWELWEVPARCVNLAGPQDFPQGRGFCYTYHVPRISSKSIPTCLITHPSLRPRKKRWAAMRDHWVSSACVTHNVNTNVPSNKLRLVIQGWCSCTRKGFSWELSIPPIPQGFGGKHSHFL